MRLSLRFFLLLACLAIVQLSLIGGANQRLAASGETERRMVEIVKIFGLSDLCVTTDARYIRHFSVSDPLSPFMDHPGSIEHFPTGSFWVLEQ